MTLPLTWLTICALSTAAALTLRLHVVVKLNRRANELLREAATALDTARAKHRELKRVAHSYRDLALTVLDVFDPAAAARIRREYARSATRALIERVKAQHG